MNAAWQRFRPYHGGTCGDIIEKHFTKERGGFETFF
jgi:hypothetical protein